MEIRIRIKSNEKEFNGHVNLLPNNWEIFCEEIEVRGRLQQTRTGANYHYQLRVPDIELYGKRNPYVHLLFKNARLYTGEWHGSLPCYADCKKCSYYCVGLGGSLVNVPFLIFSEEPPIDLTFKKERRELMQKIQSSNVDKIQVVQGDIDIWFVDIYKHLEELQKFFRTPNRPIVIQARDHKHYIYRHEGKVFRSGDDILFVPENSENGIAFTITTDDRDYWHQGFVFDFTNWLTQKNAVLIKHL